MSLTVSRHLAISSPSSSASMVLVRLYVSAEESVLRSTVLWRALRIISNARAHRGHTHSPRAIADVTVARALRGIDRSGT